MINKFLFVTILLLYISGGLVYAIVTPAWQAPDEPAHYNYIGYLATQTSFPELVDSCYDQAYLNKLTSSHFPPELSIETVCYEYHQPPLYYILSSPIYVISNGLLVALRLVSVFLGAGVVILAFFTAKIIFPHRLSITYGTMIIVAFVPMHLTMLSSVNNDALAELIFAILLYLLVRRVTTAPQSTTKNNLVLGLILGLGLITKTTVYIAVPLIALALFLELKINHASSIWTPFIKHALLIYGVALLIALPWYIRNSITYSSSDILGLARHDAIVIGQLRTTDFLAQVGIATYLQNLLNTTFNSFWGQFGWMAVPMDGRTYLLLLIFTLISLGGLIAFGITKAHNLSVMQHKAMVIMGTTIILMGLAYLGYNLTFVQFQGRYLFISLIPLALFLSLGLTEALQPRWKWWLSGGLTVTLVWITISTTRSGATDKWAILILGLVLVLAASRFFIERYWIHMSQLLLTLCYAGLIVLALLAPFWFIIPYL